MRFQYLQAVAWCLLAVLFAVARTAWDSYVPVTADMFKGLAYIRDAAMLFPAAICWLLAMRSLPPILAPAWLQSPRVIHPVLVAVLMTAMCAAISQWVLHGQANVIDEAGYQFQAKAYLQGHLSLTPQAPGPDYYSLLFILTSGDHWFSGFFPGFCALLALGIKWGVAAWVNPVLAGALVLITVWAGRRLFNHDTASLAVLLMLVSPFVLFQGASYFSHVATAVFFTLAAALILSAAIEDRFSAALIGTLLGITMVCRPLTAVLLVLFMTGWRVWQYFQNTSTFGRAQQLLWHFAIVGICFLPFALFMLYYNVSLTGDIWVSPHHVIPPYGPLRPGWHMLRNTGINLAGLSIDLLGVPIFSLVPLFLFLRSTHPLRWPLLALTVLYILGYSLHPYHGLSYGPRFYFELMPLLLLASASGLTTLSTWWRERALGFSIGLLLIVFVGVMPSRFQLYGDRANYYDIRPTLTEVQAPALVFIQDTGEDRLIPYMAGFQLNDWLPPHSNQVIFLHSLGVGRDQEALSQFPGYRAYWLNVPAKQLRPYLESKANP